MTDSELKELVASLAIDTKEIKEAQKETDKQMRETDRKLNKLAKQVGGISQNQGDVAEEFFYNSLCKNLKLGDITFDDIAENIHKHRGQFQEEYDIVMTNGGSIGIVEVKYKTHPKDIEKLKRKVLNYKKLFPRDVDFKLYDTMGDGSSNILNKDSIKDFDGKYGFGDTNNEFPADAFILNPPYSADGNGMVFVKKALSMMRKGYASIIIQNSAGSGKAKDYNKEILKNNTLIASIKMPVDIFIGKSSVQTNIYVFKVGEPHHKDETVKFIDFSNDGYTRSNRKKASNNLKDTDRAKERYQEVVDLVRFGSKKLNIFTDNEYYEGTIDPTNGADWNQSAPIDTKPTLDDFKKTVSDYLSWEVSNILKRDNSGK